MSDFLPDEIVTEILSRLPVKPLIRFRCVSKFWNSLIMSPIFINSHLNQSSLDSKNDLPLVIVRQCRSYRTDNIEHYKLFLDTEEAFDEYQELVFPLRTRRLSFFHVVGYAKGLFCFYEQDHYYLWNPSIRRSLTLPKPCITTKTHRSFVDRHGFGFDSRTKDYKVVRIALHCGATNVHLVEVYSLNAGSWKLSGGAINSFSNGATISYSSRFGTYLKGSVYFAAEGSSDSSIRMVLSFDLGGEVFQNLLLPNGILGEVNQRTVMSTTIFSGLLTLLCYDHDGGKVCSIWTLKDCGAVNSWYKQFTINLMGGIRQVLGIRNNGHIVLAEKLQFPWRLSSYDPFCQQLKNLGIHGRPGDFHVSKYEENLILLNKTNDPTCRWGRVSRKRKERQQMSDEYYRCGRPVTRVDTMKKPNVAIGLAQAITLPSDWANSDLLSDELLHGQHVVQAGLAFQTALIIHERFVRGKRQLEEVQAELERVKKDRDDAVARAAVLMDELELAKVAKVYWDNLADEARRSVAELEEKTKAAEVEGYKMGWSKAADYYAQKVADAGFMWYAKGHKDGAKRSGVRSAPMAEIRALYDGIRAEMEEDTGDAAAMEEAGAQETGSQATPIAVEALGLEAVHGEVRGEEEEVSGAPPTAQE